MHQGEGQVIQGGQRVLSAGHGALVLSLERLPRLQSTQNNSGGWDAGAGMQGSASS